ncbi:MAG: leucyl aminopeptidase [Bacteroidales bacterium]|nr:leucyl aminopeptidase [Bacteroidales bacterium]
MTLLIKKVNRIAAADNFIYLVNSIKDLNKSKLSQAEQDYIRKQVKKHEKDLISINRLNQWIFVHVVNKKRPEYKRTEELRKAGSKLHGWLNNHKAESATLVDFTGKSRNVLAFVEGIGLSSYQFLKYKKDKKKDTFSLKELKISAHAIKKEEAENLNIVLDAVFKCRDMVNEPLSALNAEKLAATVKEMGSACGARVEVMGKKKIESLKMGGLLAVNKGSLDLPTFTIMEWKPIEPVNEKPYILVGKGVVYDTGGLNIKTGNHMENMKRDMAGAATMASALYAIARLRLNVHVIALLPATDNRPDGNAYVSGDVITMHSGLTVEVINTDAEGRMILADALSYAKKYDPKLLIDAATLTGAAARAIGKYGIVAMEADAGKPLEKLKEAGDEVYERIAEFPFWEEYGELIKSNIADIKNIGGMEAGMITAGKFLEKFTDYPFIHLDIAGPAFFEKKDSYQPEGGTGIGVRLLVEFFAGLSK